MGKKIMPTRLKKLDDSACISIYCWYIESVILFQTIPNLFSIVVFFLVLVYRIPQLLINNSFFPWQAVVVQTMLEIMVFQLLFFPNPNLLLMGYQPKNF
jgi:hypothetical protein